MRIRSAAAIAMFAAASPALSQGSFVPIEGLRKGLGGPPSEVMVLGTAHISGMPETFKPEQLEPLLDRLAAWKPDIITIEGLSGPDCDMLVRYAPLAPGAADDYCASTETARASTGLDVPTAAAEAKKLLDAWPKAPTPDDRRRLAALFSAANERASALVQWLRLPPEERHTGNGLDAKLVEELNQRITRRNENYLIGAALAARLGHERVYAIDDHSSDSVTANAGEAYSKAIQAVWAKGAAGLADYRKRTEAPQPGQSIIAYYRLLNDPKSLRINITVDFGEALKDDVPPYYGRQYVAWWETRNLRMVANIRAAFGPHPGARVLSIVGMSHKPYFDAYLGMMHEVKPIDPLTILK